MARFFLSALLSVGMGMLGSSPLFAALALDGLSDETEWAAYGVVRDYASFVPEAGAKLIVIDNPEVDPDYIWVSWSILKSYNDGSYGSNQHSSWTMGHGWFDLVESDKQVIQWNNSCGERVLEGAFDLLDGPTDTERGSFVIYDTPSGHEASFGAPSDSAQTYINPDYVTGGGSWGDIGYDTSIAANLNDQGYCTQRESPPADMSDIDCIRQSSANSKLSLVDDILLEYEVISGKINLSNIGTDGIIDSADNGYAEGYAIIDGVFDIDGDLTAGETNGDDDLAAGVFLDNANYEVVNGLLSIFGTAEPDSGTATNNTLYAQGSSPTWSDQPNYVPDSAWADFEYDLIWEFKIPRSIFATSTCPAPNEIDVFDLILPGELHASPSKIGNIVIDVLLPVFSSIGDTVYLDADADGTQDVGEVGISNVTVALYTDPNGDADPADGSLLLSAVTSSQGRYLFTRLGSGNYTVVVTDDNKELSSYTQTEPFNASSNLNQPVTLDIGEAYRDADFGYRPTDNKGIIGDYLWSDANNDGLQDDGEAGIGGVTIALLEDTNGDGNFDTTVATTTTGEDGSYTFTGLDAGDYQVSVTDTGGVLSGYTASSGLQSSGGSTHQATLDTGEIYMTADFGYYKAGLGTIGNQVWLETDDNGTFDAGESGIYNLTVDLYQDLDGDGDLALYYSVIGGLIDINRDGVVDTLDDGYADGYAVINGVFDIDGDLSAGETNGDDDLAAGTFNGNSDYEVVNGKLSIDGDTGNGDDTGIAQGDPVIATAVTSIDGSYQFTGLLLDDGGGDSDADYLVLVTDNFEVLNKFWQKVSGPSPGSDNNAQDQPYAVAVSSGSSTNNTADFAYRALPDIDNPGIVGDFVWFDLDSDGLQDDGEAGIEGVVVELWTDDGSGNPDVYKGYARTDANGQYLFLGLPIADDYITFIAGSSGQPAGGSGVDNFASGGALFGLAGTNQPDGQDEAHFDVGVVADLTLDFGYWYPWANPTPATIGDYVWLDADGDGNQDVGEPGIGNVSVKLWKDGGDGVFGGDDTAIETVFTDLDGAYLFTGVLAGTYFVEVTDSNGKLTAYPTQTGDPTPAGAADKQSGAITVAAGDDHLSADFGYMPDSGPGQNKGEIGDYVWFDTDQDGLQDSNEQGIASVTLTLYEDDGTTVVDTATTDASGFYLFTAVSVSVTPDYIVKVDASNFTSGNALHDGTTALAQTGDADEAGACTTCDSQSTVTALSQFDFSQDFGYYSGNINTGSIGNQLWVDDGDGTFESASESGISSVTLGLFKDADEDGVFSSGDLLIASATTAADGEYVFSGLSLDDGGGDGDSDADYLVLVTDTLGVLNGYTWVDGTSDGADNNSQVDYYPAAVSSGSPSNVTADFGYTAFDTGLLSIGDTVFLDRNGDGFQDADGVDAADPADDETGIAGVTIGLYDASGTTLLGTATTDASGFYQFDDLPLNTTFTIVVTDTNAVLNGLNISYDKDGGTTSPDGTTLVALTTSDVSDVDFGYIPPSGASIGDRVWADTDADGIQDGGETGISGVTVELRNASGTLIATTTTSSGSTDVDFDGNIDPAGAYYFGGLAAGNYTVKFLTPSSYTPSSQDQGADDTLDSDADTGTGNASVTLSNSENDTTIDAGFEPLGTISGSVYADNGSSAGSFDGSDSAMGSVSIELYRDTDGNGVLSPAELAAGPFQTTTTAADGSYAFSAVPIGNYILFEQDPDGFESVLDESTIDGDQANSDTNDNKIPVTVSFNTDDGGNNFLDTVNFTNAINDDNNTLMNFSVSGSVTLNDFDLQGDTQTITSWLVDSDGDGDVDDAVSDGVAINVYDHNNVLAGTLTATLSGSNAGDYTFVPATDYTGTFSSSYTIQDDGSYAATDSADLTITVEPWPDPVLSSTNTVVANDDDNVSYGAAVTDSVLDNDQDPEGDTIVFQSFLNQAGTGADISSGATLAGTDSNGNSVANAGTLTFDASGNYTFTPAAGFYGTIKVPYKIEDNQAPAASDTAVLTIDVLNETDEFLGGAADAVNDPPFAGDDLLLVDINSIDNAGNVMANDGDTNADTILLASVVDKDGVAFTTFAGGAETIATAHGSVTIQQTGAYTYTPTAGYIGPDQFTYRICDDGSPQQCDWATVYIVVLPVMDFGDLPWSTLPGTASSVAWKVIGADAARHYISSTLRLGALVSGDANGVPSDLADGEGGEEDATTFGAIGADSDDDGEIDPALGETASYNLGIQVTNDTSADAVLLGYIDWNCDGDFLDAGEKALVIVDGDGTITAGECEITNPNNLTAPYQSCTLRWGTLDGSVPLMSTASEAACGTAGGSTRTFARLRLTTQANFVDDSAASPNGRASDGELEDYNIVVAASTTQAIIADFSAVAHVDGGAVVSFTTASELGSVAFRVERLRGELDEPGSHWGQITEGGWLPSRLELQGAEYQLYDAEVIEGESYLYRIIEKTGSGGHETYGPFDVTVSAGMEVLDSEQDFVVQERYDYDRVARNLNTRAAAAGQAQGKPAGNSGKAPDRLRIEIDQTGIYALSLEDLAGAFATDTSQIEDFIRRGKLHLSSRGRDVAWYESDGKLYFYGQSPDHHYSLSRTYWLQIKRKGTVMAVLDVEAAASGGSTDFIAAREHEVDNLWTLYLTSDPESNYWFWDILVAYDGYRMKSFSLPIPGAQAAAGELKVRVTGVTDATHLITVSVKDGADLGQISFSGKVEHEATLPLTAAVFNGDFLDLELTAENSPSGDWSTILVDAFEVTWQRAFQAESGTLKYSVEGDVSVSGFANRQIVTLDIINRNEPLWVEGGETPATVSGFVYNASLPASEYVSTDAAAVLKPLSMHLDVQSDLANGKNRADYVIITHAELMPAASALAAYRSADFETMIVDIQDIYNEFTFGEPLPGAINAFVKASQSWRTAPRYFVIVGDGSFDYRDLLSTGYNFVSPQLWGAGGRLFAGDTLLGDVDDDGIPELAFGRIPIKNVAEGLAYVEKLSAYELQRESLPGLLLSDVPDKGGDFTHSIFRMAKESEGDQIRISLQDTDISEARIALAEELAKGVRMINYLGHGGTDRIASQGLITNADAANMDNAVTPGFVGLTCLINNFSIPGWDGLGERLVVREDGGMVYSWAASGESFNDQATLLGIEFQRNQNEYPRLGDAIIATFKAQPYLVSIYTLIGDPAILMQQ